MAKSTNEYLPLSALGSFPEDWEEAVLSDVCLQVTDGTHDSPKPVEAGGFPLVTGKAIKNRQIDFSVTYNISGGDHQKVVERSKPELDDILFANIGNSIGDLVRVATQRSFSIKNVALFKPNPKRVYPRYLEYFLLSEQVQEFIKGTTRGSAQPFIGLGSLRRIPISLPSLMEQRKIGDLLGSLDDRITLLRETNATLEAIAQALFKSWFVDFDPVRAKMAGRAPEGMDEATAALFPDALEETELGVVPKGWAYQSFVDMVDVIGGGTPKTTNPEYWGGTISWFSVVDAPNGADTFVVDTEKHITEAGLAGSSTKLLPKGTTIITARGTVGKLAVTGRDMAMNQSCYGLIGKAGDAYFTYFATCRLVAALKSRSHGSVFDTITRETLASVESLYPPQTQVIDAFEDGVKPLMERILSNLQQAQTLASLRDTLLPRLISGQLRLPEAQTQLQDALA